MSFMTPKQEAQATIEHVAWRQFCLHLEQHLPRQVTINDDCDSLMAAVKLWGEELVKLRAMQEDSAVGSALTTARVNMNGNWLKESE